VTLLDLSQLKQVLDTATRDLFRWETLPAYEVASDGSDYLCYLDGADAPTPERKQPWLDILREWAEQGRPRRRVQIIHDPITDYERYACEWGYALNSSCHPPRSVMSRWMPRIREIDSYADQASAMPSTKSRRRVSAVSRTTSASAYSAEAYQPRRRSMVGNSTTTTRCDAGQSPWGTSGWAPRTMYRPPCRAMDAAASSR
jgi:hypothetical protein